jgi:hypothetical protein
MKNVFLLAVIAAFSSCNSGTETKDDAMGTMSSDSTKKEDVVYAYPVNYSNWEIADSKNAQTILNLWKDWDNADLSKSKDNFADTVELHFRDGSFRRGSRDSVIAAAQTARNTMSSVVSSVFSVVSLNGHNKPANQNENWVAVWGKEVSTNKKGKIDSAFIHEIWRLNKDGKADLLFQLAAPLATMK